MSNIKANDAKWLKKRFSKLTVEGFFYKNKRWFWECLCDCGNRTTVYPNQVIRGKTTSCGCNRSRTFTEMHTRHGMSDTRIYRIWKDMRRRCNPLDAHHSHHYGDRGIRVCKEWLDFNVFYDWSVSNGYTDSMSIERIDFDGNYCPENCKWILVKEQPFNSRHNILVELDGVIKPVGQWADMLGLSRSTVYGRISKGMSPKDALRVK